MNERKALEAAVWLLKQKPGMTRHNLAKILYYADKWHLEEYGRPITGDRYIAMQEGMVPSHILDMLERDGRNVRPEDIAIILEAIEPYQNKEGYEAYRARRDPDTDYLSRSDMEYLRRALDAYGHLSYQKLRELAHDDPAWKSAWNEKHNSEMDYEQIIGADHPKRDLLIEKLRETSRRLAF